MKSKELKNEIEILEEKLDDPQTPQGDVKQIKDRISNLNHQRKIAEREEYESGNKVSVYGSDDYVGASAGDLSFYFGYEVTRCPIKSHKTDDDCYEKDCDKREWVFQVTKNDDVVFEMLDSEISYPEADDIERKMIIGMAHYIKTIQ